MQDRLRTFLFLCLAMFLLHTMLKTWLDPPKPPKQEPDKVAQAEKGPEKNKPAEKPDGPPKVAPVEILPEESVTLGSADESSPYRMLVTLTNRGAAVERIELNSAKFHDLEDRSGYLGHLAETDDPNKGGCKVGVVGAGTPAEKAGLKAGDIITRLGDVEVRNKQAYRDEIAKTKPEQELTIEVSRSGQKQTLTATLARRPLEVVRPEMSPPGPQKKGEQKPQTQDPLSFLLTLDSYKTDDGNVVKIEDGADELAGRTLRTGTWKVLPKDPDHPDQVTFEWLLADLNLRVVKIYSVAKLPDESHDDGNYPAYHLNLTIEIHNTGDKPIGDVAYRLDGPTGLPTEGAWYAYNSKISPNWRGGAGMRDVVAGFYHLNGLEPEFVPCEYVVDKTVKELNKVSGSEDEPELYFGVDAQYFSVVMMPQKKSSDEKLFAKMLPIRVGEVSKDTSYKKLTDVSCRVISLPRTLSSKDATIKQTYQIFAGPKRPYLMAQYNKQPDRDRPYGLDNLIVYGLAIFAAVSWVMLQILHFFYSVVQNYGVAIVMLTILVRSCMLPISLKQAKNAAKMQELAPEIKRINELYKNNKEQQVKAQQELWKKHGYNPFSGCLPVLLQLPIFLGLYRSLAVDVELRQAPLLSESIRWCSNLAAPDMLFEWRHWAFMPDFLVGDMGWLGPYFNLMPLATMSLFILQQKMFMPPPTDEQSAMQQKVMMYMTVFMGVMFFKVASGLCIYFIASSIWGIAEKKLLPKAAPKGTGGTTVLATTKPGGGSSGNGQTAAERKRRRQRKN
jgi:YidC/Oxa1 family membrane protein insertase